jgi:hypothetical protein
MDQFRDFQKYVKGVDPYGMQSGIVLIDPPEEWYVTAVLDLRPPSESRYACFAGHLLTRLQETCPQGPGRHGQDHQD